MKQKINSLLTPTKSLGNAFGNAITVGQERGRQTLSTKPRDLAIGGKNRGRSQGLGSDLKRVAAVFKRNISIGLDIWALLELAQCEGEDMDRLALLMM